MIGSLYEEVISLAEQVQSKIPVCIVAPVPVSSYLFNLPSRLPKGHASPPPTQPPLLMLAELLGYTVPCTYVNSPQLSREKNSLLMG